MTPRYMTETVSATWRTIARSCEISSRPSPRSRERRTSRFAIWAWADAAREECGKAAGGTREGRPAAAGLGGEADELAAVGCEAGAGHGTHGVATAALIFDGDVAQGEDAHGR